MLLLFYVLCSCSLSTALTDTEIEEKLIRYVDRLSDRLTNVEEATINYSNLEDEIVKCQETIVALHSKELDRTDDNTPLIKSDAFPVPDNITALLQLHQLMAPRSCHEWKQMGFEESGNYLIDPDGSMIGQEAFTAYCDMITGSTLIYPLNSGNKVVESCKGVGCYQEEVKYKTSNFQMHSLIKLSYRCRQHIKIDCKGTPFIKDDVVYSWWEDRNGDRQYYWAGDHRDKHTCSCGLSSSCVIPRYACNCNTGLKHVWLSDQGYISNSTALPVTKLAFGATSHGDTMNLKYLLGPLKCYGTKEWHYPKDCEDVWRSGSAVSRYYYVGEDDLRLVYCDMEAAPGQDKFQQSVAGILGRSFKQITSNITNTFKNVDAGLKQMEENEQMVEEVLNSTAIKKETIAFSAKRKTNTEVSFSRPVDYSDVYINLGDGLDAIDGLFRAPTAGTYFISFHSELYGTKKVKLYLKKNNDKILATMATSPDYWTTLGTSVIAWLDKDDSVGVYGDSGELDGDSDGRLTFTGFLLYL